MIISDDWKSVRIGLIVLVLLLIAAVLVIIFRVPDPPPIISEKPDEIIVFKSGQMTVLKDGDEHFDEIFKMLKKCSKPMDNENSRVDNIQVVPSLHVGNAVMVRYKEEINIYDYLDNTDKKMYDFIFFLDHTFTEDNNYFIPYFEEALDTDDPKTYYGGGAEGFCNVPQYPAKLKKYVEKHDFS